MPDASALRLVGHKGADLIAPGNTVESFHAAAAAGVDTIELDVLWLRDAHLPLEQRAPLVVAHDWHDAERRTPLKLTEALDAFLEPPLDGSRSTSTSSSPAARRRSSPRCASAT